MARLIWMPRARTELRDIRRYIARNSPQRARIFIERVDAAIQRLAIFPTSGRIVPEDTRGELREVFVSGYRIMYRVNGDRVEIAAIIHGARRLADAPDSQE